MTRVGRILVKRLSVVLVRKYAVAANCHKHRVAVESDRILRCVFTHPLSSLSLVAFVEFSSYSALRLGPVENAIGRLVLLNGGAAENENQRRSCYIGRLLDEVL